MDFTAVEEDAGKRLDVFVTQQIDDLNRSNVSKLCNGDKVAVNGDVKKAKYKVRQGDKVSVDYKRSLQIPTNIDLPIIYEDQDCLVIDKPVGLLTHSKGTFNPEATIATLISPKLTDLDGERGGIVHRLDRATSGVMICAKSAEALSWLQKQFSERKVKKTYVAVINGIIKPSEATIDMPIKRNPKKPQTFRVGAGGKPSTTHYKIIMHNEDYSLLELKPTTGRTHQLRVHLKHFERPIVGDVLYDGEQADRLYLHAQSLEITLLNRKRQTFTSKVPSVILTKAKA